MQSTTSPHIAMHSNLKMTQINRSMVSRTKEDQQVPHGQRWQHHGGQTRWNKDEADQSRRIQDWRSKDCRQRRINWRSQRRNNEGTWQDSHSRGAEVSLHRLGGTKPRLPLSDIQLLFFFDLYITGLAAALSRRGVPPIHKTL